MSVIHRPRLPDEDLELPENMQLYADALKITLGGVPKRSLWQQGANVGYWLTLSLIALYFFSMAIDRELPVTQMRRGIINPQVEVGTRVLNKSTRVRHRVCELTRRSSIVDGIGRRIDFEPEHFDGYAPASTEPYTDITGPVVPLDAAPGHGRLLTVLAWDCNILQRALGWSIVLAEPPLDFEILPRKGS